MRLLKQVLISAATFALFRKCSNLLGLLRSWLEELISLLPTFAA
jgi:hypothetical protein